MIAVDTSSLIAYLEGDEGSDVERVEEALKAKQVVLPPVVLTELLSVPGLAADVATLFKSLPLLELTDGYWERAGATHARVLVEGHKARVADALIAQFCLDHELGLITRDGDFKAFSKYCGLLLIR